MGKYRSYDWRIKQMILDAKDPGLFPELQIPRSTALGWINKGFAEVVTLPSLSIPSETLVLENQRLKNELEKVKAKQELALFTFKLFGLQIQYKRLPNEECKEMLLAAIKGAAELVSLTVALEVIGLSMVRWCIANS